MILIESLFLLATATAAAGPDTADEAAQQLPLINILEAVLPLDGATELIIDEDDAEVRIIATDRDDIAVTIELESRRLVFFSNRRTTWAIHRAEIVRQTEDVAGDEFHLAVAFPVAIGDAWLLSRWRIEIPAVLAAKIVLEDGSVEVIGLDGGVFVRVTNGSVTVDVDAGPIDVATVNGGVDAVLRSADYGVVTVSTVNGGIGVVVDGEELASDSGFGPEAEPLEGPGDAPISLKTINGSIALEISPSTGD